MHTNPLPPCQCNLIHQFHTIPSFHFQSWLIAAIQLHLDHVQQKKRTGKRGEQWVTAAVITPSLKPPTSSPPSTSPLTHRVPHPTHPFLPFYTVLRGSVSTVPRLLPPYAYYHTPTYKNWDSSLMTSAFTPCMLVVPWTAS